MPRDLVQVYLKNEDLIYKHFKNCPYNIELIFYLTFLRYKYLDTYLPK